MEYGGRTPRHWAAPAFLRQPIDADLTLPDDGRWESALLQLARVAHLDMLSDGYLSRAASVMRGDAVLYVWSATAQGDPEGFHDRNFHGVPYGVAV